MRVAYSLNTGQLFDIRCDDVLCDVGQKTRSASYFEGCTRKKMPFQERSENNLIIVAKGFFSGESLPMLLNPTRNLCTGAHMNFNFRSANRHILSRSIPSRKREIFVFP